MTTEEFKTLSPLEQTKAIAKDVLLNLKIGRYTMSCFTYFSALKHETAESEDFLCKVCACGAAVVSYFCLDGNRVQEGCAGLIRLRASWNRGIAADEAADRVLPGMTAAEICLIEMFFMGSSVDSWSSTVRDFMNEEDSEAFEKAASWFQKKVQNPDNRAALIFEQIAETGHFAPQDLSGYPWCPENEAFDF